MKPIAIDPPTCGCTECITGEYIPLISATARHITDMLAGRMANNTGLTFTISATGRFDPTPPQPFSLTQADVVTVTTGAWVDRSSLTTYSWEIDPVSLEAASRE